MTYQTTTGTLSPGAHAGSYNGQDAYNDMLVVDDGSILYRKRSSKSTEIEQDGRCFELHGRPDEATLLHRGGEKRHRRLMQAIIKVLVQETAMREK